ncbi:unnamed protein product [Tetraodon nigroviridis]|uniref:ADP-ribosyl cyclase/cyclic ADP-ribose hydrolase n=1 Tax=Tetraodon nigroviridis TaxID=99883 RepID=Q4S1J0_TETNG|nr:unnamed protein product [Tetraodon nigroviridis]
MLVVMGGLIVLWLCAGEPGTQSGTTPNIKEIAMGRCYDYVTRVKPGLRYDCEDIWRRFEEAVGRQAPCNVTVEDYGRMFYAMAQTWAPPCGRFLFWSKTKTFVQTLVAALRHFWTLEDTLAGFMFNDLLWCGREDEAGRRTSDPCSQNPGGSGGHAGCCSVPQALTSVPAPAGRRASTTRCTLCGDELPRRIGLRERHRAAERIRRPGLQQEQVEARRRGRAPAEDPRCFCSGSMFGSVELDGLDPCRVNYVNIKVVSDQEGASRESCGRGSVVDLIQILRSRGFRWTCADSSRWVGNWSTGCVE